MIRRSPVAAVLATTKWSSEAIERKPAGNASQRITTPNGHFWRLCAKMDGGAVCGRSIRLRPQVALPTERMIMSATPSSLNRRSVLAISAAAATATLLPEHLAAAPDTITGVTSMTDAIRPFHVNVPEEQLVDLRRRLAATRWPDKETVADDSQGVPSAMIQGLARYWAKDYDWRKVEARLN